jgi:hypothetical protein
MPHIVLAMTDAIDVMKGNATEGTLVDLRAAVVAADAYVEEREGSASDIITESLHAKLEEVQDFLLSDSTSSMGVMGKVGEFADQLNTLLP